jgi:hypothetical protein
MLLARSPNPVFELAIALGELGRHNVYAVSGIDNAKLGGERPD